MYVNTNVAAMNAWLNLENTQTQMTGTLQQLSSGYRINTAANDPAGLAISQQMQSEIDGLKQAYSNAQSGVSLLQTADGGLGQIQNILQSMRSLASEAATSTMNSTDTANLQTEMNQYAKEITQIANTTQFNNINLLGGAFGSANNPEQIQIGANQGQTLGITLGAADAYTLGITAQSATVSNSAQSVIDTGQAIQVAGATPGNVYSVSASVTPWSVSVSGDTSGILALGLPFSHNSDAMQRMAGPGRLQRR
jgi:flagellin